MSLRTALLLATAAIVMIFVARFYFSGHQVPAGQPALAEINGASLAILKSDFNQNSDRLRLILLLSPT